MDNIYTLYPQKHPIRHFVRIGHSGYRKLENLYAAGRAPIRHAVVDAGHLHRQKDLVAALLDADAEIILDTKSAELATLAGLGTKASLLPWGSPSQPHRPGDWAGVRGIDKANQIAEFSVANRVDTVLSPAHLLHEGNSHWTYVDIQAADNLRRALDRAGGHLIRIDYHLMMSIGVLKEFERLVPFLKRLRSAPIDNIWMRISGFGMRGSPAGTRRYIDSAWQLAKLRKPLIADHVGGLAGLSLSAFGAVGGICHGVAEKENFNTSHWQRVSEGSGSSEKRIYLPDIDEYLYRSKVEKILAGRNSKSLIVCKDRTCCSRPEDMFDQSQAHALIQSARAIDKLNAQPELKRIDYLVDQLIPNTLRNVRRISKVKIGDQALTKRFTRKCSRLELLQRTLDRTRCELETVPFARTPISKTRPVKKVG